MWEPTARLTSEVLVLESSTVISNCPTVTTMGRFVITPSQILTWILQFPLIIKFAIIQDLKGNFSHTVYARDTDFQDFGSTREPKIEPSAKDVIYKPTHFHTLKKHKFGLNIARMGVKLNNDWHKGDWLQNAFIYDALKDYEARNLSTKLSSTPSLSTHRNKSTLDDSRSSHFAVQIKAELKTLFCNFRELSVHSSLYPTCLELYHSKIRAIFIINLT